MYMPESLSCNLIFTITNLKAIQKNHYIFNMTAHNDIAVYITKWLYSFLMQIFVQKVSIHMTRVTRMIKTKKRV